MNYRICLFLVFFLKSFACLAVTADPVAGEAKTQTCVACHGNMGNSVVPEWPKLAGQHKDYLVKQIKEIKMGEEGPRSVPTMYAMVAELSDQDIADIASYYAEQTQSNGTAKEQYVELGRKIYRGGNLENGVPACIACHGPQGMGNGPAKYPRLQGQHAAYTELQLNNWREGLRNNDPSGMMAYIAKKLTEEEIKAVSSYIEGLR